MKNPNLDRIIDNLTRPIPEPYRPPPKPTKSWRTLKVGDRLECIKDWGTHFGVPAGTQLEVVSTDANGCVMVTDSVEVRVEDPDWKDYFKKVRRKKV